MIELTARAWKLNIDATCRKLDQMGFELSSEMPLPDAIRTYKTHFLAVRQRVRRFWESCVDHFAAAGDGQLRGLQHRLGVNSTCLGKLWMNHGGEILGSQNYWEVEKTFIRSPSRLAKKSGSFMFKGKGWANVLVIPFWRLPGRLSGFLCIGRDMDPEKDFVFVPVREGVGYGQALGNRKTELTADSRITFDSGLAMLPAAFAPEHPALGSTLVATNDVITGMRLQLRHLKTAGCMLPLVATYNNEFNVATEPRIFRMIPRQRIVFWSPRHDLSMMAQAFKAKARYTDYNLPLPEIDTQWAIMRHHTPHGWLKLIHDKSARWDVALRQMLTDLSEPEIEELVLLLDLTGPSLREFIEHSKEPLRERLTNIYTSRSRARQIRYDKHIVTEEADGWHVKGSRISSAIVRIDQLLQARSGRNYYRGVIIYNGEQVPFTERTENVKPRLLSWASNYLEMAGKAGMTYVNSWDRQAINVALSFQTPKVVTGVDAVGWDKDRSQFNFPKFAVKVGGDVLNDYACLFNDKLVPGRDLEPPATLSKKEVKTLGERDEETAIFWGTVACVAANVLAPAVHCDTAGLVLDGAGAQSIGWAAAVALGCPEHGSTEYHMSNPKRLSRLGDSIGQHHWPYILQLGRSPDLSTIESWLVGDTARQAILSLPWASARAMGIRGWNVLRYERKLGSMQLMTAAAARVLPAYLGDLCSRHLFIDNVSENHTENVLRDISGWFADHCGGDGQAVLDALNLLELPGKYPAYRHFMDVVFRFIHENRISLVRKNFEDEPDGQSVVYDVEKECVVWIPEEAVVDTMEKHATVPPTILAIQRSLDAAGGLIGQRTYNDKRGWLVKEEWWTGEHAAWKARTAKVGGPIL